MDKMIVGIIGMCENFLFDISTKSQNIFLLIANISDALIF